VVLETSDGFFCFLFAVLRPLALLAVVRVAMGYELYPMFEQEQTTIRAIVRAESYTHVIPVCSCAAWCNVVPRTKRPWLDLDDHGEYDGATVDRLLHSTCCRVADTGPEEIWINGVLERGNRLLDPLLDDRVEFILI
jgi:hypothetical protein